MKKIILMWTLALNFVISTQAFANYDIMTWDQARIEIRNLTEHFRNSNLTQKEKVKYLPRTNEVLSYMQDLRLSPAQKSEQIEVTVQLLLAAAQTDFANSTTDTVYFDFKANKKAYLQLIKMEGAGEERSILLENFKNLEDFEKNPNQF